MLLQKVFATHCHFLSFLFSFFYVNMHSKSMEQHSRSYPTIYQKLGLEFWIEKKDIMQAIVASHCALYQDSTRILAFFNIFLFQSWAAVGVGTVSSGGVTSLFSSSDNTGRLGSMIILKKININFLIWCLSDFVFLINICLIRNR